LGLEEIGEYTPDKVRAAFANLGLISTPVKVEAANLPTRPPALCPGCPHRAFFYALNMVNQHIHCENEKCSGCGICEYTCSFKKEGVFNAYKSRIRTVRINQVLNTVLICRQCKNAPCITACPEKALKQSETGTIVLDESLCKGCDWCMQACEYGSIYLDAEKNIAFVCNNCEGEPECIQTCPEQALTLTGSSQDKIVTGDIGCYTLGVLPPVNTLQTCLCMGAGISQAAGMVHAGVKEKIFAVIGDSTFFHAGLTGLVNIAYNKANVCVIVLDNNIVAMTGHQPTPASGKTAMGTDAKIIKIKDVAKGLGIDKVDIVNPYDVKSTIEVLRNSMLHNGPSVIISEQPCPLLLPKGPVRVVTDKCQACRVCVRDFGCPAISLTHEHAQIDPTLCHGCGVCQTICPFHAIEEKPQ
jgi:TPP-dependent indolepyruvate ferredoxin oxidoreductase alpha subunit